ncbi:MULTISPECIES: L-histidine N(alpha)-methyltransferase [unclassified Actinopolyspora]|uniref:L-histidine N(alpha)-methyltransferase n=1 Tax=Actinopolyspora TaxID=1849 RepID=UPI0013F639A4|nr:MULTISPECIES: L-histidine N(alpha)-methyltransferase [unclassified Actinopolyspora]NHD16861.1 L-histidine N(alpha)-methyltransferase [Actinopolyspora sp. BKK2]NHE76013.1 L-histidine N(alpha)-methyltransferase [Actinopolyspora sp. BKK1]
MNSVEPLDHGSGTDATRELLADARAGLTDVPKWLPPKWFYDARGSELFERITELPEYYQTRAEYGILERHALDIVERTGVDTLVELGSGSSYKTRLLLDAMRKHGTPKRFVPSDVSRSALRGALAALSADYPELELRGIVGDFATTLAALPAEGERMIALLGGTIGNMPVEQRGGFLREVRGSLARGEWFLLGTDLVKDPSRLCRAYDDGAGVTAEFNRNVLHVLNRELGGNFPVEEFEHRARYERERERIVLTLRAGRAMRVWLRVPELAVDFAPGEEIETEMSAKFRRAGVEAELEAAGFELAEWYTDEAGDFAVSLARAR